jgi:C-terminal processing protease CtpA/Prc
LPNPRIALVSPPHLAPIVSFTPNVTQPAAASSAPGLFVPHNCFELEYELAWDLIRKHFLYRDRLTAWSQWQHRFDGTLENARDTDTAIDTMVQSLGDQYTYFRDRSETQKREKESDLQHVVTVSPVAKNISSIHITTFNSRNCVSEMKNALLKLKGSRAYILDLRGNSGGSIANAMEIFSLLSNSGEFMEMEGVSDGRLTRERWMLLPDAVQRINGEKVVTQPRQPCLIGDKPLTVIVDKTTRSAAEMLAGALRDNKHARLIGSRTYGKGVIQRIWQFDQGTSVKITAARYFLPKGSNIQSIGLKPDIAIAHTTHGDAPLQAAIARLRRS